MPNKDFLNNEELMYDFSQSSKEDFLAEHPEVTEEEYDYTENGLLDFVTNQMRMYSTGIKNFGNAENKAGFHKLLFDLFMQYEGWEDDFISTYKKRFGEDFEWHNEWVTPTGTGRVGVARRINTCVPHSSMRSTR